MHDEKRSIASILEDGLDMVLNLLAFMGAYVLTLITLADGTQVRVDSLTGFLT